MTDRRPRPKKVDTSGMTAKQIADAAQALIDEEKKTRGPATKPDVSEHGPAARRRTVAETAVGFDDDMPTHERDIVTSEVQPARAFRDQAFAQANIGLISDYADYRVMGWNPERAFIRVFGTDYGDLHLFARIEALEHNLVYRQVFAKRFGATPLNRMFSVKHAIWHWLSLLNNPFVRETVRAQAIVQLQTIYGITVVDEAGTTKASKTLDDFYAAEAAGDATSSNPQAFRHPDPGSPEAIAFEQGMRKTSTGDNGSPA